MKTLITTVAAIAIATPAFAGDLPSKAAPASAPVAAAKSSTDSYITVDTGYEADKEKYGYNDRKTNTYNLTFNHAFAGGFNAGFAAGTGQIYSSGKLDQTLEVQGGYNLPAILGILVILVILVTMVYGPIAAMLVELFPTRIRYTSMSLPYHIGNGWFGGLLPTISFALVAQNGNIYYGLWYPIIIAAMTLVIGVLFVKETKDVDIYAKD
jgi:hypothetical protein